MKIIIEGDPKELAELVVQTQTRQDVAGLNSNNLQEIIIRQISDVLKATRDTFSEA